LAALQLRPVVLVVEDEPLLLWGALAIVAEAGLEGIGAANADAAIRILESRNDIRVVFTDVHMPGSMDGVKLAHAVRGRWPPVKIIVTSGVADNPKLPDGTLFFPKPYNPDLISKTLQELAA